MRARSPRGTRALQPAGFWLSVRGLRALRLGFVFGWGLEGLFAEGIPAENRRRFDFPANFAGEIPGISISGEPELPASFRDRLILNDFLQPRTAMGPSSVGRNIHHAQNSNQRLNCEWFLR